MESCTLSDFMKTMEQWLSKEYIRNVVVDKTGSLKLIFADGVSNTFRIDDCNKNQLKDILKRFRKKGIPVAEDDACS